MLWEIINLEKVRVYSFPTVSLTSDGKYLKSPVPGDERHKIVWENSGSELDNFIFTDLDINS